MGWVSGSLGLVGGGGSGAGNGVSSSGLYFEYVYLHDDGGTRTDSQIPKKAPSASVDGCVT